MEVGPSVADRRRILGHFAAQQGVGVVLRGVDRVKVAPADAPAAAFAQVLVDAGLAPLVGDGVRPAFLGALAAAPAQPFLHHRLAGLVLLHLAGPGPAAHPQVFQRPAEAGGLVPLEVVQRDHHVGVHDGPADLGGGAVLGVGHRHLHIVGAPQPVGNDQFAAGGHRAEAVLLGGGQVFQGVFPPAGVQGVAVGQERQPAVALDGVGHRFCVVGAQVGQVARLAEMDLDGDEPPFQVEGAQAGGLHQPVQFLLQGLPAPHPEVGIINGRLLHGTHSLSGPFGAGPRALSLIIKKKPPPHKGPRRHKGQQPRRAAAAAFYTPFTKLTASLHKHGPFCRSFTAIVRGHGR